MAGYNIGEAFVLDNSAAIKNVGQILEKERQAQLLKTKQQNEENALIMNKLGKMNGKGLQRQDLPEFQKKVADIKDTYYKYRSATNDADRMAARMDIEDKFGDANEYVNTAVTGRQEIGKYLNHAMTNRLKYDDSYVTDMAKEIEKPVSQINFEKLNPLNRERKVDTSKIDGMFTKLDQTMLKGVDKSKEEVRSGNRANRSGSFVTTSKEVPMDIQLQSYKTQYDNNDDVKHFLNKAYPTLTPDQQILAFAQARRGLGYLDTKKEQFFANRVASKGRGGSGGSDKDGVQLIRQVVDGVMTRDPDKVSLIKSYLPQGSEVGYTADNQNFRIKTKGYTNNKGNYIMGQERVIPLKDSNAGEELASFLYDTDIRSKLPFMQKVHKAAGKPVGTYSRTEKTEESKGVKTKASSKTLSFFNK